MLRILVSGVWLLLVLATAACFSGPSDDGERTPIEFLSVDQRNQLEATRTWVKNHSLRVLANEVEVRIPDDLRHWTTLDPNPQFFERVDDVRNAEVSGGSERPCMKTTLSARALSYQAVRLYLEQIDLAALSKLVIVYDPGVADILLSAKGSVTWELDHGGVQRQELLTFAIP